MTENKTAAGWYVYRQNNSGGVFDAGCGETTYLWAKSVDDANLIAQENGIYFDGVADGVDCSCCGDRWWRADQDAGYPADMSVSELAAEMHKPGRADGPSYVEWAANWKLGIRLIDKYGTVYWILAEPNKTRP